MPSCDGSNCGACSSACGVSESDYDAVVIQLAETKKKLAKALDANKRLKSIKNKRCSKSKRKVK